MIERLYPLSRSHCDWTTKYPLSVANLKWEFGMVTVHKFKVEYKIPSALAWTRKIIAMIRHAIFVALLFAISSILTQTSRAENNHPAKAISDNEKGAQRVSVSAHISAEIVRDYIKWIVDQTSWPTAGVPPIKTTSPEELGKMLLGPSSGLEEIIRPTALYSKNEHLIYLATTWKKDNVLDQSILVHELMHHLQVENHIQLECWGRYEAQAYELQIRWLRTQGVEDPYRLLRATRTAIDSLAECPQ